MADTITVKSRLPFALPMVVPGVGEAMIAGSDDREALDGVGTTHDVDRALAEAWLAEHGESATVKEGLVRIAAQPAPKPVAPASKN